MPAKIEATKQSLPNYGSNRGVCNVLSAKQKSLANTILLACKKLGKIF